jgi:uncharacterized protein (DUF2141 family)
MKRNGILILAAILISNIALSQHKLDIEITGIKNDNGKIMLELLDVNQKTVAQEMGLIKDKKCNISFPDLKPGKYAVRYYHDENLNGKMETSFIGKPTEGYGFSNNVTGTFGPPPFEKWLFEISGDKKISLKPLY